MLMFKKDSTHVLGISSTLKIFIFEFKAFSVIIDRTRFEEMYYYCYIIMIYLPYITRTLVPHELLGYFWSII